MSTANLAPLSTSAQQILSGFKLLTTVEPTTACLCGDKACDLTLSNPDSVPFKLEVYGNGELNLYVLSHSLFSAIISDQGGQLISWQPSSQSQDCIFMSELDPYKAGTALRGGIPVCYPWFGKVVNPAHGTARISFWQEQKCVVSADKVTFTQQFNNPSANGASLSFEFSRDKLRLVLDAKDLDKDSTITVADKTIPVTAAFHTYFNISDIGKVRTLGLPVNSIPQILEKFPGINIDQEFNSNFDVKDAIRVNGFVDNVCNFSEQDPLPVVHTIYDPGFNRRIDIIQEQATDCVFWNPWDTKVSALSDQAYKHMLCVETGRISQGFNTENTQLIGVYKVTNL